ncbi:MAG: T9SS type A sorting domain-containing protein [Chitinophagales bacterium]
MSVLLSAGLFAQTLDTLDYPITNATGFTAPGAPNGGGAAGSNIFVDEVGQVFSHPGGTVEQVIFWLFDVITVGSPDNFEFSIYDVSNGFPTGVPLATEVVSASSFNTGSVLDTSTTVITFSNPPTVSGDFAIVVNVDLSTKNDSLIFVTNNFGDGLNAQNSIANFNGTSWTPGWDALDDFWIDWDRDIIMFPVVQSSTPPPVGTCDTLINIDLANDTLTIYNITGGGTLAGHNAEGFTRFAEKFISPYTNSEINEISFAFNDAQTSNPGTATITARIWEDDGGQDFFGIPNAPGTVIASEDILITDIATDITNNDLTTVTFTTPPVVSGDFYVGFEVTYAAGDSVALITNQDESIPSTLFTGLPTVWGRVDSVYGLDISGLILADICESTTQPAPVANFEVNRRTVLEGNDVQFTDLSTNNPSSWSWTCPGGNPGNPTQENPLVTYNTSGVYDVSLNVSNSGGSDDITASDFITVLEWPALPDCDTISNFSPENDALLILRSPFNGYVAGHNAFMDQAKADKFSGLNAGDEITGAALGFAVADFANSSSSIDVNVWDNSGTGGAPGAILASETITIQSIATDISNNSLTYVNFTNPVTVNASTDYYVGISFTYAANDTVALYVNADGEAAPETAWEQFASGNWFPYSDTDSSWNTERAHLISPLVCAGCPTIGTTINTTNASCGASDGTATVNVMGGAAPYSFLWSDGQMASTATNLAAGSYDVTVTDANNCTATASANVSDTGSPSVTLDDSGEVSCNGGNDGYVSVVVTGGTPPYTYTWSSGGNTATETGLSAGTYDLTVEDANGCSETFSETIAEPTALSVNIASVTDLGCASVNDGAVDINVSGGTSPYTFAWDNGDNTEDISGLAAGTYEVTVTDDNGCTEMATATVDPPANPLSVSVNNAQTSACGANDATLTANASGGSGGNSYSWTGGLSGASVNNLSPGNYTVTVTDGSGCTATASASVSDPGSLSVSLDITNVSCNGFSNGEATANVTGNIGTVSYNWDVSGSGSTVSSLAPGAVSVTVTEGSCSASANGTVTEPDPLNVSVTQTNVTCNGGINGTASAFVTGGTGSGTYSYQWLTNPIKTTSSVTGLEAGSIILNVTDANNCQAAPVTVTITQPLDISVQSINTTPVTCYGDNDGTAELIGVSGGTAPYAYNWSASGSASLITGLSAGSYQVTISDINNCQKVLTANIGGPDSISISVANVSDASCNGDSDGSISLSVTGGNGGYNWSNGQSGASTTLSNLAANNYFVTVTDNEGCSKISESIEVDQPDPLTLTPSFENVTCNGGSDGEASVAVNGGIPPYSFSWTPGSNSDSVNTGLPAGPFTVVVTDDNGCDKSSSFNIANGASPAVNITSTDASANADDGTATADATGGASPYTYSWNDPDNQDTQTATGLAPGTYTVTVTDANGCPTTATVEVERSVSIGDIADISNLQLFPNPTSGTVNLKLELSTTAKVQIEWINVLGAQVASEFFGTTTTVNKSYDLGQFAAGIYFAKIRIDNEMIVKKVIVSKQ